MTFLWKIGSKTEKTLRTKMYFMLLSIFRGVRIVAVILCTTGIALLAYMDGVDPKEGVSIESIPADMFMRKLGRNSE